MAAVTYGSHSVEAARPNSKIAGVKRVLTRVFWAIAEARMRQAEREIALHRHLLPADFEVAGRKINERSEDSLPFVR